MPKITFAHLSPLILFAALAGIFMYSLSSNDPSVLPSALIGKPVPEFSLPALEGLKTNTGQTIPGFATQDLKQGEVSIVNVWASWCVPCRQEHPVMVALSQKTGAPVFGLNQKDTAKGAKRFLSELGNPFKAVGVDNRGRVSLDWGIYGIPETFIVNGQGEIVYKHIGPITPELMQTKLIPAIEKAREDTKTSLNTKPMHPQRVSFVIFAN